MEKMADAMTTALLSTTTICVNDGTNCPLQVLCHSRPRTYLDRQQMLDRIAMNATNFICTSHPFVAGDDGTRCCHASFGSKHITRICWKFAG
jgi:hypothetical protein